jgi:hypothetical protein
MRIEVRPRYVAAPWELEQRTARRVQVGLEDDVRPDPGPVALYRTSFPDREVIWNRDRQLFEIRSTDPASAFTEYVFFWDAWPDPADGDRVLTAEDIAEMVERGDGRCVKRWAPFDYAFVERRIREKREYDALGANRAVKMARRIADHNANVQRRHRQEQQALWDDYARHDKRWLGVLAALHAGERPDCALTQKVPLIQTGMALS